MTRIHSSCPHRDVALLYVLFATGAKPLEIARLEVRDYLDEDGTVRSESEVRSEVAINGKARPLYFASEKVVAAIDVYLKERVRRGLVLRDSKHFRGLDPLSRLFLTDDGHEMRIRVKEDGKHRHHVCHVILDVYRKIFNWAGLRGASTLSGRRTVAKKLHDRGCDLDSIGEVLGLKGRDSVRKLVPKTVAPLKEMLRQLI
jgi:integrase